MTPDCEKELIQHPSRFYSNLYYFECHDGWADILSTLADRIEESRKSGRLKQKVKADQVKEKFGRLVVYFSPPNDQVDALVKEAQESSWSTCEHCGKLGSLRRIGSYLTTLCDDDYHKWLDLVRPQ